MNWNVQKFCTDISDYELTVEQEKTSWHCTQNRQSWKWRVAYHGSIVASGSVNDLQQAKDMALANVPRSGA